jgi:hypothetical protein
MNRTMLSPFRQLFAFALLIVLLVTPAITFAFCSGYTRWLDFPAIPVINNGTEYTDLESSSIVFGWEGKFEVTCGVFGRVKNWEVYPLIYDESLGILSFQPYSVKKSYPVFKRPKEVNKIEGRIFPDVYIQNYAIASCNSHANQLRHQGYSDTEIFGNEHIIPLHQHLILKVDTTIGEFFYEDQAQIGKAEITCKKWDGLKVSSGASGFGSETNFKLVDASLILFPSGYEGKCPADLHLFMKVEANLKGIFEAHIESSDGWKSDKVVLQTTKFVEHNGNWMRDFDEILTIPVQIPTPPHSDSGVPPGRSELSSIPHDPGVDIPGSIPDWTPADSLTTDSFPNNDHKASLRLVAKTGDQIISSKWRGYNYKCEPKVAIDVPSGDLFIPQRPAVDDSPVANSTLSEKTIIEPSYQKDSNNRDARENAVKGDGKDK